MTDLGEMPSQDPALDSFEEDVIESGHADKLSNPERGCGHLERGKAYVRGIPGSANGCLPSWVEIRPPIPYKEVGTEGSMTRGYIEWDGLTFQLTVEGVPGDDDRYEFIPHAAGMAYEPEAFENMVNAGLYDSVADVPRLEVNRHIDRVKARGLSGQHFGAIDVAGQTDLLMRAGKKHYPNPVDFAEEAKEMGISKAIPVSQGREPPVCVRGITRLWIVHPEACEEEPGYGIIGYGYVDEVVYTEPADGEVPGYIDDYESAGKLRTVDIEDPPEDDDGDTPDDQQDISDFVPSSDAEDSQGSDGDGDGG